MIVDEVVGGPGSSLAFLDNRVLGVVQLLAQGAQLLHGARHVGEDGFFDFDLDFDLVEVRGAAVDDNLVVRLRAFDAHQHVFDLRREAVHAADDHHVVGAAEQAVDAHRGAAAGAGLTHQEGDVARAIT